MKKILESHDIEASAPCRIDMGGTLDISTFYYPLRHLSPCTFNIAIDLMTRVRLLPFQAGLVKITSRGFTEEIHRAGELPFDGPMGLMFAVAAYFNADGVHIDIHSSSPPKSALGGSSVAACALVAAFSKALSIKKGTDPFSEETIVRLAHDLEQSVAGVPCGIQDQMAAVFGGVNLWNWSAETVGPAFSRERILNEAASAQLNRHLLIAYCGVPHESRDVNGRWVRAFKAGQFRNTWKQIIDHTRNFARAVQAEDYSLAGKEMNAETELRLEMTPDVLDEIGMQLFQEAGKRKCGARFTGAGGGGCLWAIGDETAVAELKPQWEEILSRRPDAKLLKGAVDTAGLRW